MLKRLVQEEGPISGYSLLSRADMTRSKWEKEGFVEVESATCSLLVGFDSLVEVDEVVVIFESGEGVIGKEEFAKDRQDFGLYAPHFFPDESRKAFDADGEERG
jgi:hypothetical protein